MIRLAISRVHRRADARPLNQGAVDSIAESIREIGLINPIRIRPDGDGFELIAGSHRLAAHEKLGLVEIDCVVVTDDDLHAELAMIDENLLRAELSPSERASQTARRKAIYVELHPETRSTSEGGLGRAKETRRQLGDDIPDRFTTDTAKATGQSERKVQRDAERGEKVIDEVLALIRGTKLDTGAYLDKMKRLPPNDQVTAAKRDLAYIAREDKAKAARTRSRSSRAAPGVKAEAAKEVARIIAAHVPTERWDATMASLLAAGAGNIAAELRAITTKEAA